MMMRSAALCVCTALLADVCDAAACAGTHLAADADLRIGKKFKPENCTKTSKKGDSLRVHYRASTYSDCVQIDESYYEGWT